MLKVNIKRGDAYLINYTKRNVFIISLIISLCIFFVINYSITKVNNVIEDIKNGVIKNNNEGKILEITKNDESKEKSEGTEEHEEIWQIEIPKINLIAPINEGTSQEIMLEYVGHFENTSTWKGNVGLAAHNRGYPINYFAKLKELKEGDKIIYKTNNGTKTYSVELIKIIEDIDWSYLEETDENKITLITCVENKPSQRLCVQAKQIKEE